MDGNDTCVGCGLDSEQVRARWSVDPRPFFSTHVVQPGRSDRELALINKFRANGGLDPIPDADGGDRVRVCGTCLEAIRHHIRDGFKWLGGAENPTPNSP